MTVHIHVDHKNSVCNCHKLSLAITLARQRAHVGALRVQLMATTLKCVRWKSSTRTSANMHRAATSHARDSLFLAKIRRRALIYVARGHSIDRVKSWAVGTKVTSSSVGALCEANSFVWVQRERLMYTQRCWVLLWIKSERSICACVCWLLLLAEARVDMSNTLVLDMRTRKWQQRQAALAVHSIAHAWLCWSELRIVSTSRSTPVALAIAPVPVPLSTSGRG